MSIPSRLVAKVIAQPLRTKTQHYRGVPPELTSGDDVREQIATAAVLVIETEDADAGVSLIRFAANSRFAGDTWHQTIEEAKEQASFEFGNLLSDWVPVPPEEKDVFAFALRKK